MMSNSNAERAAETSARQDETSAAGTARPGAGEPDAGAVIEALNAENSQLKDRVLRTLAEMENLRRRTEREVADAKTYGVTSFARDMLTVVDNLARALEHFPPEARASADPSIRSMVEGVELTARDLETVLPAMGSRSSIPRARSSIPIFTRRFSRRPTRAVPAGTVSQVVQSGWTIGDRVLRPAMVGVSKGGPGPRRRKSRAPEATALTFGVKGEGAFARPPAREPSARIGQSWQRWERSLKTTVDQTLIRGSWLPPSVSSSRGFPRSRTTGVGQWPGHRAVAGSSPPFSSAPDAAQRNESVFSPMRERPFRPIAQNKRPSRGRSPPRLPAASCRRR